MCARTPNADLSLNFEYAQRATMEWNAFSVKIRNTTNEGIHGWCPIGWRLQTRTKVDCLVIVENWDFKDYFSLWINFFPLLTIMC